MSEEQPEITGKLIPLLFCRPTKNVSLVDKTNLKNFPRGTLFYFYLMLFRIQPDEGIGFFKVHLNYTYNGSESYIPVLERLLPDIPEFKDELLIAMNVYKKIFEVDEIDVFIPQRDPILDYPAFLEKVSNEYWPPNFNNVEENS